MKKEIYLLLIMLLGIFLISCESDSTSSNTAPGVPLYPSPAHGSTEVGNVTTLSWSCEDPDGDDLTFSVYMGTDDELELVATGLTENYYETEALEYSQRYYWQVRADDGEETTQGSKWRFTVIEENVAPNQPSNPVPEDGIIDTPIDQLFRWYSFDINGDDVSYDFYLSKSEEEMELVATDLTICEFEMFNLDYHTVYYWQIKAKTDLHESLGPVWNFETRYHNYPPENPHTPFPINGDDDITTATRLSWNCSDPEDDDLTYDLYLGTDSNPAIAVQGWTSLTYYPEDLQALTTYYWRVDAWDGNHYSHGPTWEFTTGDPNSPPNLPYMPWPADGATGESVEAMLRWSCSDPDGDELMYKVYFGVVPELNEDHVIALGITDETWELGELNFSTTYYWKITAHDGEMQITGDTWSFTTEAFNP